MNAYSENITSSLENSRNSLRRIGRYDEKEFSHQSVLYTMEKFVKSVNMMDETILLPCRLMDLKVGDENDCENQKTKRGTVQELLGSVDLFQVYNMLNNIKAHLLWGQGGQTTTIEEETVTSAPQVLKGHVRRPSTVSVASTNSSTSTSSSSASSSASSSSSSSSSTISDSESDAGNENDSGIEESDGGERTEQIAENFKRHLLGLTQSLRQMTEAAQYLTKRYQHDIGGPV